MKPICVCVLIKTVFKGVITIMWLRPLYLELHKNYNTYTYWVPVAVGPDFLTPGEAAGKWNYLLILSRRGYFHQSQNSTYDRFQTRKAYP